MKKSFLVLLSLVCLLLAPPSWAQQQKTVQYHHEISSSYGMSLLGLMFDKAVEKIGSTVDLGELIGVRIDDIDLKGGGSKGVVNLGYAYQINKRFQFGISGGFNRVSIIFLEGEEAFSPLKVDLYSIMGTAQVNWFRTRDDRLGIYSKLGAGVMLLNIGLDVGSEEDIRDTRPFFSPHLTLLGLEVGRGFRGFLELGAGMQGLVQVGIKARF